MILDENSKPKTLDLYFQKESQNAYIMGSKYYGRFISCDERLANIAHKLNGNNSLNDIQKQLNLPFDEVVASVLLLFKAGFIETSDNPNTDYVNKVNPVVKFFANILFSPPALLFYVLNFIFVVYMRWTHPDLLSSITSFFWSGIQSFNILTFLVFSLISLFIHESGHVLAGIAFGAKSRLSLSNRLYFLVVETNFPDIYALNYKKRIIIYLAGMFFDLVSISLAILLQLFLRPASPYDLLIEQFILVVVLGILWECMIFMKTDLYYVFSEFFKIFHLQSYAFKRLKNFLSGQSTWLGMENLDNRKKQVIRLYTVLFIVGSLVALVRYFVYIIPIFVQLFLNTADIIKAAYLSQNYKLFIDSTFTFVIQALQISLLVILLLVRKSKRNA